MVEENIETDNSQQNSRESQINHLLDDYHEHEDKVISDLSDFMQKFDVEMQEKLAPEEYQRFSTAINYRLGFGFVTEDPGPIDAELIPEELKKYIEENSEEIEANRSRLEHAIELTNQEYSERFDLLKEKYKQLEAHFKWEYILEQEASEKEVKDAITFFTSKSKLDSFFSSNDSRHFLRRLEWISYHEDILTDLGQALQGSTLISEEETQIPELTEEEYSDARNFFSENNIKKLSKDIINIREYYIDIHGRDDLVPETAAIDTLSAPRLDENGIPTTIFNNKLAIVILSKRANLEKDRLRYDSFYPTEIDEAELAKARQTVISYAAQIKEWGRLSYKYKPLNSTRDIPKDLPFLRFAGSLNRLKDGEELPTILENNPSFLIKMAKELSDEEERLREYGVLRRPEGPWETPENQRLPLRAFEGNIQGLEYREGLELIILEPELRMYIMYNLPTSLHKNVDLIHITNNYIDEDTGETHEFVPREVSYRIANRMKRYYREDILKVIYHEFFEDIKYDLTLDEMEAWEKALENDRSNPDAVNHISNYSRRSQLTSSSLGDKEDFCDTGSLFITSPEDLQAIAPERYEFMLRFLASKRPKDQEHKYIQDIRRRVQKANSPEEEYQREIRTVETTTLKQHDKIPQKKYEEIQKDATWITQGEKKNESFMSSEDSIVVYMSPYFKIT